MPMDLVSSGSLSLVSLRASVGLLFSLTGTEALVFEGSCVSGSLRLSVRTRREIVERVNVAYRLCAVTARPVLPSPREQVCVERIELVRPDVSDVAPTQNRENMMLHVPTIGLEGARLDLCA